MGRAWEEIGGLECLEESRAGFAAVGIVSECSGEWGQCTEACWGLEERG